MQPIVSTERLRLRRFVPGDADFILRLVNDRSFLEHIGDKGVRDLAGARRYLDEGPLASYAAHGFGLWRVALQETDEPVGMAGILRREGLDAPDLGYAFLPAFCGRGLAVEAAAAVMGHARGKLGIGRMLAVVSEANTRSVRLLERLGFEAAGSATMASDDEVLVFESFPED